MRIEYRNITNIVRITAAAAVLMLLSVSFADAQTRRTGKTPKARSTAKPKPTPTPTPYLTGPEIISRASDQNELELIGTPMRTDGSGQTVMLNPDNVNEQSKLIEELRTKVRQLEADKRSDPDAVQKRLLLNLDILTRAEQRSESLRKQGFEMIEKENEIRKRLDVIEIEIRPEMIERSTALAGSLRPEEVREARRKQLEGERGNLQTLLSEVQRNRSNLEVNIQRADSLVERLRLKLEKDIDDAIADEQPVDQ